MKNKDFTVQAEEVLEAFGKNCIRTATGKVIGGMHLNKPQALNKLTALHQEAIGKAVKEFIAKQTIIEKFETLAEYIPKQFQKGYIEGMREEAIPANSLARQE